MSSCNAWWAGSVSARARDGFSVSLPPSRVGGAALVALRGTGTVSKMLVLGSGSSSVQDDSVAGRDASLR